MDKNVPAERWVCEEYDEKRGAYVLGYYKGGLRHCTMWGYKKPDGNVYRVYPRKLDRFVGYEFPKVKEISIFDVKSN